VTTLVFHGDDLNGLFDTMTEAVRVTLREQVRPAIEVNGKLFGPHELLKVAALLPHDGEARLQHQAMLSLAHLANRIASAAASRDAERAVGAWLTEAERTLAEWNRRDD